jgi:hypothetical protein
MFADSVALLTFLVGVAVAPIQFYAEGLGHGKVIDGGGDYAITRYKSSYFIKLWFEHESYVSPEKANQVFNEHLIQAVKVIEVGPKINRKGAVVGRRATALFFSPEISGYYTEIFWTDGHVVYYISSTSALHAKEFETHEC